MLDLSSFEDVSVSFNYYVRSFENVEDFWLQISIDGGQTFQTIQAWVNGTDFNNDEFKSGQVTFTNTEYGFTNTTQLRFRCDASGNGDWVYLDDIEISGCSQSNNFTPESPLALEEDAPTAPEVETSIATRGLVAYPNPFTQQVQIKTTATEIYVFDVFGKLLQRVEKSKDIPQVTLDLTRQSAGVYYVKAGRQTVKLVKQ